MKEALKVGVSGVRGVVGDSFTPQLATTFAEAFGTFVGRGPVVVGRDTRPSGEMFEHAVVAGLTSVGCAPVLAGVAPTPSLLVLTAQRGARGGIAITASHNPAPWNALKFIAHTGLFLDAVRADALFDLYHHGEFARVAEADLPAAVVEPEPTREHFARVFRIVDVPAIRARRFKVAVDCVNGVGGVSSARFLGELGCEVVTVFEAPHGRFEREPEPLPEHLGVLAATVVREGCAVGFAQDPDGDRLAIVDERGEAIGEDLTLALACEQILACHAQGPVVCTLSTSRAVEYVAQRHNCPVTRCKVGEIHVVSEMQRIGAVVGGESNGGVIVPAMHPCRDSYTAMALVLELLATRDASVAELRAEIPRYALRKQKLQIRTGQAPAALRALRRAYADHAVSLLDGFFVDLGRAWAHVRRSNTEPVLRITVEAEAPDEADRLVLALRGEIEAAWQRPVP